MTANNVQNLHCGVSLFWEPCKSRKIQNMNACRVHILPLPAQGQAREMDVSMQQIYYVRLRRRGRHLLTEGNVDANTPVGAGKNSVEAHCMGQGCSWAREHQRHFLSVTER